MGDAFQLKHRIDYRVSDDWGGIFRDIDGGTFQINQKTGAIRRTAPCGCVSYG